MELKTSLIGLGRIGAEPSSRFYNKIPEGWLPISHIEAIKSTEGLNLIAVCDTDEKRLEKISNLYSIKKTYKNYEELIKELNPDIISIATRTDVRCDIINFALENGAKGFYAEKPLSRSLTECERTLKNIIEKNAKIVYGASRRAMNVYQKAKEIIWSGDLGEVTHISVEFGKASLLWTLPHAADTIIFFANNLDLELIQGCCNLESNKDFKSNIVDCDPIVENAFFKFKNNITASISPIGGNNIRIACSKGILTVHGNGEFIEINKAKSMEDYFHGSEILKVSSSKSGTQNLFIDLKNAVSENKDVVNIKPAEILLGHEMLFGIVQSTLQNGTFIKPDELNRELIITGRVGQLYA
ncbi:MAG: Gfo/Idh/MocA family oxidoreductase [Bacteroidales bacterium]|nr:Gfo/Idh/MocA family oxidoreductase [Bacteroidales bacterium]